MTLVWDVWWLWIAGGLLLLIVELLAPAFIALGFAVGAFVVGLVLAVLGIGSLGLALVLFAATSLVAWIAIRRAVGVRKGQVRIWDTDINE